MTAGTLALSGAFAVVTAAVLSVVALRLRQRSVSEEARTALLSFALWWFGLAAVELGEAVTRFGAAAGIYDLGLYTAVRYMTAVSVCAAIAGLVYYVLYLYSGKRSTLIPVAAFYLAFALFVLRSIASAVPAGVAISDWSVELEYAFPPAQGELAFIFLLGSVPALASLALYAALLRRPLPREQKFRIATVTAALSTWILVSIGLRLSGDPVWNFILGGPTLVLVALAIYLAYEPPRFVKEKIIGVG